MEFLGVGPMELILILVIALIILGPNDMVKTGKTMGRTMRRIVKSPLWAALLQTSHGLRTLPNRLMREAGLEEDIKDLQQTQEELRRQVAEVQKIRSPLQASLKGVDDEVRSIGGSLSAWTTQPGSAPSASSGMEANDLDGISAWVTPPPPAKQTPTAITTVTTNLEPLSNQDQDTDSHPSIETSSLES